MSWYFKALVNYYNFKGRASRREFWTFFLTNAIIFAAFLSLGKILHIHTMIFYAHLLLLAIACPLIAVSFRRLHDIDKSSILALIFFIPVIGKIFFFIMMCMQGTPGANRYGMNTHADTAENTNYGYTC
ncbi:MAG: DUF805 domain-containing protein [Bacillota bacterium]|nr:DUF805 domain-containing protein [Bacillota bacterium]